MRKNNSKKHRRHNNNKQSKHQYQHQNGGGSSEREMRKLFVDQLDATISEQDIFDSFRVHGEIEEVARYQDRRCATRYFAFVVYKTEESCLTASRQPIHQINGKSCSVILAAIGSRFSGKKFFVNKGLLKDNSRRQQQNRRGRQNKNNYKRNNQRTNEQKYIQTNEQYLSGSPRVNNHCPMSWNNQKDINYSNSSDSTNIQASNESNSPPQSQRQLYSQHPMQQQQPRQQQSMYSQQQPQQQQYTSINSMQSSQQSFISPTASRSQFFSPCTPTQQTTQFGFSNVNSNQQQYNWSNCNYYHQSPSAQQQQTQHTNATTSHHQFISPQRVSNGLNVPVSSYHQQISIPNVNAMPTIIQLPFIAPVQPNVMQPLPSIPQVRTPLSFIPSVPMTNTNQNIYVQKQRPMQQQQQPLPKQQRLQLSSYNPQNAAACSLVDKFQKLCAIQSKIRAVEAEKDRIQMEEIMRQQAIQQEQALMRQSRSHSVIQYQRKQIVTRKPPQSEQTVQKFATPPVLSVVQSPQTPEPKMSHAVSQKAQSMNAMDMVDTVLALNSHTPPRKKKKPKQADPRFSISVSDSILIFDHDGMLGVATPDWMNEYLSDDVDSQDKDLGDIQEEEEDEDESETKTSDESVIGVAPLLMASKSVVVNRDAWSCKKALKATSHELTTKCIDEGFEMLYDSADDDADIYGDDV